MDDTVAVTIEADDGEDEITLPTGLIARLSEPEDTTAQVVADVALMSFTGRAHALRHHAEGGDDGELDAIEADLMERFEERFGLTYEEATGHSH